jgi:hypothetical protein
VFRWDGFAAHFAMLSSRTSSFSFSLLRKAA